MLYVKCEDAIWQHMENAMGDFTFFFSHSYLSLHQRCKREHWKCLFSFNLLIHSSSVIGHLPSQHLTFIGSFFLMVSVSVLKVTSGFLAFFPTYISLGVVVLSFS